MSSGLRAAGTWPRMLFNAVEFLFVFLPAVLAAYYLTRRFLGHWPALAVLNLASLVFYAWWDVRNLPLLLGSVAFNHALGVAMVRRGAQPLLALGIAADLALLALFKYAGFIVASVDAVSGAGFPVPHIALPLAISFFTFQQISFLVDVVKGRTRPGRFLSHLLFVSFFPHLVAGPIVQHHQIAAQFADARRKDHLWENLGVGLSIFAVGLAKKVLIADALSPIASAVFDGADTGVAPGLAGAWVGGLAYALQIYFDFSGYSDMALGLARSLGYRLPVNFNAPYRSASVVEFWRRWHITLSRFLRDYLYIPLGGNLRGEARRGLNLLAVMLLGGLWHGAAWTFVAWGGLHGLGLVANHAWTRHGPKGWFEGRRRVIAVALTFVFTTTAWVLFRARSFAGAGRVLAGMGGLNGAGAHEVASASVWLVLAGLALVWSLPDTASLFYDALDPRTLEEAGIGPARAWRWRAAGRWAAAAAILLFLCVINAWKTSPFIYYAF